VEENIKEPKTFKEQIEILKSRHFTIDNDKERFILNIEPQGYYESSLPARMLRYRSDVWEYTMRKDIGIPSIKQVVVFFYQKDDNKQHELKDERSGDSKISFSCFSIRNN